MEKDLLVYRPVIDEIKQIISSGQRSAYGAANAAMVLTYWQVRRIIE